MKCKIPEISWHNRDPVLSVDIQARSGLTEGSYRLASGGTDSHVLIWYLRMTSDDSDVELDLAADLARHQRAVNVVKWSPNGELLASGDDESVIFIWKQRGECEAPNILETTNEQDKEVWITMKVLRGHMEDVYDLSWAPNSLQLVSGSVDNSAMLWDVHKGKSSAILQDHKGFVQGVAWDPRNQHIATLSTDRHLRIFDLQTKRVLQRTSKGVLPVPKEHELYGKRVRFFHDDTLQTFFRRLCYTPDGKLLLTPAGIGDYDGCTRPIHTAYAFSRNELQQPSLVLPCIDQYAVAVRCCPLLFKLRAHSPASKPVVPLSYRMIFAVATRCSVYFYDTQQPQPFAVISNIHYTRLTDATWSSDGRMVVVSSTDGFCSLITFASGELGEEYEESAAVLGATSENSAAPAKRQRKPKESGRKLSTEEPDLCGIRREPLQTAAATTSAVNKRKADQPPATPPTQKRLLQEVKTPVTPSSIASKLMSAVIIDKEILSSNEKFESPEKRRPATFISVRRHPRTPTTVDSLSKSFNQLGGSPLSSVTHKEQRLQQMPHQASKRATPIAVRNTPRAIIVTSKPVDSNVAVEEAMDAWPLPIFSPEQRSIVSVEPARVTKPQAMVISDAITERTEDMCLVYEDTLETETTFHTEQCKINVPVDGGGTPCSKSQQTPNERSPRRVALTTISTPKSKKKILE